MKPLTRFQNTLMRVCKQQFELKYEARTANKVLPKAGLMQYYWANESNSTLEILLRGNAEIPRLRQSPNR
jgi:hypothetical protein